MNIKQHIVSAIRSSGYRLDQVFLIGRPDCITALRKADALPDVRVLEEYWVPGMSIGKGKIISDLHVMSLHDLPAHASPRRRKIIRAIQQGLL